MTTKVKSERHGQHIEAFDRQHAALDCDVFEFDGLSDSRLVEGRKSQLAGVSASAKSVWPWAADAAAALLLRLVSSTAGPSGRYPRPESSFAAGLHGAAHAFKNLMID